MRERSDACDGPLHRKPQAGLVKKDERGSLRVGSKSEV